ncbi:MAG: flagellar hook-associated protein FlgK [Lachnoclostridium sp.]|jgi:flagellar hook-associated protein 1 FlgK|nr:flagellar hook-associated protein FlgK [Lachnoclostridium sp.]
MAGPFDGFNIAVSGMSAYQLALNTTGHNVANEGTLGYSKQTVDRSATTMGGVATIIRGSGVSATGISVTRNEYYDIKYRNVKALATAYDTKSYYLKCMDNLVFTLDDETGGMTNSYDSFFQTIGTLMNATDDSMRQQAVTFAESYTEYIRNAADGLQKLQEEANGEIKAAVDQINTLATEIAYVTKQINTIENYGPRANDLRDQRNVLLDQLSVFVEVDVTEQPPLDGVGFNQYIVYINDSLLMNGEYVRKLDYHPRDFKKNINDVSGLYDLRWSDGDKFYAENVQYAGSLQTFFTIRDGNNMEGLKGNLTSLTESPEGKQVLTLENTNINDPNILNIPPVEGALSLGGIDYVYESFEVSVDAEGKYTYAFTMKREMTQSQIDHANELIANGKQIVAGTNMDFKGIPFLMSQLNEFARTFSENFNNVHKKGFDYNGEAGIDFFNAKDTAVSENYIFYGKENAFSSIAGEDAEGNRIGSYYHMTCLNFNVSDKLKAEPRKIAASNSADAGRGNHENINELSKVKEMENMFVHGTPESFLQVIVSSVSVEGSKAESFAKSNEFIFYSVENRRQEISGTDKDEEARDLIRFQSLLNNQFKVLSVMNEILNKLINDTGVG